jgi:membrane protein
VTAAEPAEKPAAKSAADKAEGKPAKSGGLMVKVEEFVHRWTWSGHAYDAWTHLKAHNGTQYSAAITYFSFLALFPLLLLAASIAGFVLSSDHHLQQELLDKITANIPGSFGKTLSGSINTAVRNRTSIGIIGLAGVLLTGLGWVANLRQAIDAVAGHEQRKEKFLVARLRNLMILGGLGLGVLISIGLTVVGTAVTQQILSALDLDHVTGITFVVKAGGVLLSVLGDLVIFAWVLVQLPALDVKPRVAIKGVVLAAVGFELLKLLGTYTIAHSSKSPTLGPFAGLLAVLIWIELVSRFLLYCVAWMSTDPD